MTTFTSRRNVLTGAAAATAATAVASKAIAPANAAEADDLAAFVNMSAALTGIAAAKLAPAVDPIKIRLQYFELAKGEPAFANLMKIFNDSKNEPPPVIAAKILKDKDAATAALARSIMLAWYLGAWYPPADLISSANTTGPLFPKQVISSAAYTQGWAWRVAQAHPMGYSEQRFGYWSQTPEALSVYVGV